MPIDESEWLTRKTRIDTKLKAWGWEIVPFDPARPLADYHKHAVEEYETANGPADYALIVGGRILGIVEAKKVGTGPQNVLVRPATSPRKRARTGLPPIAARIPTKMQTFTSRRMRHLASELDAGRRRAHRAGCNGGSAEPVELPIAYRPRR